MSQFNLFRKYTESKTAPFLNLVSFFFTGLIVISVLSFIYSCLITLIPTIYFNVVIVFAFGYTIAYASRYLNLLFKIRHRMMSILMTGVLSLFAVYLQWVMYLYIISNDIKPLQDFSFILELIFRPDFIFYDMNELNKVGAWEIGSTIINGTELWLIWLTEALLIISIPLRLYSLFDVLPFSEKGNQWYKKKTIITDFEYILLKQTFLESFYQNSIESLTKLDKGNGIRYSKINVFSDKNKVSFLISIENVSVDSKGQKEFSDVLEPSYIDRNYYNKLNEEFKIE